MYVGMSPVVIFCPNRLIGGYESSYSWMRAASTGKRIFTMLMVAVLTPG